MENTLTSSDFAKMRQAYSDVSGRPKRNSIAEGVPDLKLSIWRRVLLRILNVEVKFTKNAPRVLGDKVIITSNHQSLLDGLIVGLAIPRKLKFAVTPKHSEDHFLTSRALSFITWMDLGDRVSLSTQRPYSIRKLLCRLKSGGAVLIFPEGKICDPSSLLETKPGTMWLYERVPDSILVTVSIENAWRRKFFSPTGQEVWHRIKVTI